MTSPRPSLRTLFETASGLPRGERARYLGTHCDAETRTRIERMLDCEPGPQGALPGVAAGAIVDALADAEVASMPLAGTQIGPFELVGVLGDGGSSTVFHATRTHDGVRQDVALKLLRRGLYSDEARRLFRRERLALSRLQHPGIARLIEGGVTENGFAYIALELVKGVPITEYARTNRLGAAARLRIFLDVCRAVDAAHRALIVHRDLKPSNVLVTDEGEMKLLDFGISKLLGQDDETHTRLPAFTPAYASPEQRTDGLITTATDVYALGVLLGELMTGERLSDASGRTPSGSVSDGLEAGVLPAAPAATRRLLKGDLDNIVLKALQVDPALRYASAGNLADDIERLRDGQPVVAHPPSRWYRARKFVGRHRGGVLTSTAFLLAVLTALGFALWQAKVAREEAARANAVRDFVEGLFEPIREGVANGKQPSLTELVDKGAQRIDANATLGSSERVDLLLMFSRLYDYLNEKDRMQTLADHASEIADSAFGRDDPRALDAAIARGTAALRRADYTHAEPLLAEVERHLDLEHEHGDAWIRVEDSLAVASNARGDPGATLAHERAALATRIGFYGENSGEAADGRVNLGYALEGAGRFADAVHSYRLAYAKHVEHNGAQTGRGAATLGSIGGAELMAGDLIAARTDLREALAVFDQIGGEPSAAHLSLEKKHCLAELVTGSSLAQATCAHTVELARQSEATPASDTGLALRMQGLSLLQEGDIGSARKALESSQSLLEHPLPCRGRTDIALGETDLVEGNATLAAQHLALGLQRLAAAYPVYLHSYGLALLALACHDKPVTTYCPAEVSTRARGQIERDAYGWNPLLLPAHIALARIDLADARPDLAAARLQMALDHARDAVDPTQPYLIDAKLWLAVADAQLDRCDRASVGAHDAMTNVRSLAVRPHPLLAEALAALRTSATCGKLSD